MGIEIVGASEVAAAFEAGAAALPTALGRALDDYGQTLADAVRSHASGRPGPNIITGEYVGSVEVRDGGAGPGTSVAVGTDAPQGWRLEMGFHGTDSAGRSFQQPPYPHWGPAVDETEGALDEALAAVIEAL